MKRLKQLFIIMTILISTLSGCNTTKDIENDKLYSGETVNLKKLYRRNKKEATEFGKYLIGLDSEQRKSKFIILYACYTKYTAPETIYDRYDYKHIIWIIESIITFVNIIYCYFFYIIYISTYIIFSIILNCDGKIKSINTNATHRIEV